MKGYAAPMAPKGGSNKNGGGGANGPKVKRDTGEKSHFAFRKTGRGSGR